MDFQTAHDSWLNQHLRNRRGEAKRKLEEGYQTAQRAFAEKVWWPAIGNFNHLTPEYEVRDFADRQRFLDFAYVVGQSRICVEIDGFGPHWRDISRRQFADQWNRQNHLIADGWKVYRFAYDEVMERPRGCQQFIQQVLGLLKVSSGEAIEMGSCTLLEREIVCYMKRSGIPYIKPATIITEFHVGRKAAHNAIQNLHDKQIIIPLDTSKQRYHKYRLQDKV